jgi:Herelleviridae exonuclease
LIPVQMIVQNFKAITGPHTIPLREQGIVHVLGQNMVSEASDSNGSSKTALMISAPCWCFTGRTEESRRVVGGAAVRNRWQKGSVYVAVEYEDGGERYMLARERTIGGNELVRLTGPHGRIWDAKHEIEARLGFDWAFFTNVVVFGPDTSARFSQAVDTERKAVFDRIIPDLERLNRVHERADASLKALLHQCDGLEQEIAKVQARLEEIAYHDGVLEQERHQIEGLEFERWVNIMRRQKELRLQRIDQYEKIAKALMLSGRMAELKPKVEGFVELVRKLREAEKKVDEQSMRVTFLKAKVEDNVKQARELLAHNRCPTCHQKFDKKAKADIIGLARGRDDLSQKQLEAEMRVLDSMAVSLDEWRHVFAEQQRVTDEYDKLASDFDSVDVLRMDLDGIERQLDDLEANEKPPVREVVESRGNELRTKLRSVQDELDVAKSVSEVAKFWVDALKVKIKSKLLDGVEEYLDDRLRHYSSALTAGEITIGFAARTKLKKGTHQDKIAITAEHLFGAAELDLHSSGERQRIDLAIILALQDLARQQHGSAVRLSLFDEVFDHLDETGVERLMELMAQEKSERGTVAIVTQNPRISAHPADHQLVVRRTKEGTTVVYDEEEV